MKKWFLLFLCMSLLVSGCWSSKQTPPPKTTQPNTNHISAEQGGVKVEVSRELRTFPKSMIATKEGFDIVGISVVITNNSKENVPISPDNITLVAVDNTQYKYSEVTSITGKGAFKAVVLPPEYRGGGLLLYEIKKGVKIDKIVFKDKLNHDITIKFDTSMQTNI